MQLVWAENVVRGTNGRVLVLTPLGVAAQTVREGEKFGVECRRSRDGALSSRILVANYERLDRFDPEDFSGIVCDESSILKSFDGVRRAAITAFMRRVRYRLLCTATAAPNDWVELGTSSEALGELGYVDMLGRFFVAGNGRGAAARRGWGKSVEFRLKGHAEVPFWRWVASWARALRYPSDIGFPDDGFVLPSLYENTHVIEGGASVKSGHLFDPVATDMRGEREATRRTLHSRCERAAELASARDASILWCNLNDEGDLLERLVTGARQVSGDDPDERKEELFLAFASGQLSYLVTKPRIGGWGLNFQRCAHVSFFPTHSFEQYYQAVRRCWRFGQTRPVTADIVGTSGLLAVMENLERKRRLAAEMFERLVSCMREAERIDGDREFGVRMEVPAWL